MNNEQKLEKYSTSPFERWFEDVCQKWVPFVPNRVSPNQLTILGFLGSVVAGFSFFMASYNRLFFLIAIFGLFVHLVLDNVDGAVARARNLTSQKGQFLDIFTDSIGIAFIFLGVGFSNYAALNILIFPLILWYLHLIVGYNWITLKNKWIFPLLSNFEIHITLAVLALIYYIYGVIHFNIFGISLGLIEIVTVISVTLGFCELFYYAIKLYRQI